MTEIEIYTKVMEIVEGEDPSQALFALDFVKQRLYSEQNAKQQAYYANNACVQSAIGGGLYPPSIIANEQALEIVRNVVREELAKSEAAPAA